MNFPQPKMQQIQQLLHKYQDLWAIDVTMYEIGSSRLVLPQPPIEFLIDLCRGVKELFEQEPVVLRINENCVILGDLHGHILDLFRVLRKFGLPPTIHYIFLGDLVDRGEFSIETITLVFVLKAMYPKHVHIVRGNHEFLAMFQYDGFANQVEETYHNSTVTFSFANAFAYMPLAAVVFNKILCVHGGIGAGFTSISQLENVGRPLINYDFDPVISAVWSDPKEDVDDGFIPSTRGVGYFFGKKALVQFLTSQNLEKLVRGHEPCEGGIKKMLDGNSITVFGASNYCNYGNNKSGVLHVTNNGSVLTPHVFPPIKYIFRQTAIFVSTTDSHVIMANSKSLLSAGSSICARPIRTPDREKTELPRMSKRVSGITSQPSLPIYSDKSFASTASLVLSRTHCRANEYSGAMLPRAASGKKRRLSLPH